jgi:hypothetical protein
MRVEKGPVDLGCDLAKSVSWGTAAGMNLK